MEHLLKSFDSFSARHQNTAFFKAINQASDVMEKGLGGTGVPLPINLATSLEHAGNYIPHASTVEFLLKPDARIIDMRFVPKSEKGTWDASLGEEDDAVHSLGRAAMVRDNLIDGIFHEMEDVLEIHNPAVLVPVRVHKPAQEHLD